MRYRGSMLLFGTNSSMSIVRVDSSAMKLVLRYLNVGVGIDLVALDDFVVRDFFASISVDLQILDAMAGLFIDLIEADFLRVRRGRIQSDRTGNEGKAQEPLPVGAGCHEILQTQQKLRIQNSVAGIVPAFK